MYMSTNTHVLQTIKLSFSCYLPEDLYKLWPKRLRAESTHPENWPKRPTYQGRIDPPPKLAETTQAETTQAETTQGRNDPDSNSSEPKFSRPGTTGVIQLIPPVLSSETLLHILLSSEYSGFRPSTTAVVTQTVHT